MACGRNTGCIGRNTPDVTTVAQLGNRSVSWPCAHRRSDYGARMAGLIIGLVVLWLVLVCIGFAVKTLSWLIVVGLVLVAATLVFGALKGLFSRR
jgi:hypothetical protein